MPRVSPLRTLMLTCSTARTVPRRVANSTVRSRTSSSGISAVSDMIASPVSGPPLRVDDVAHPVAEQIEAEHREHQRGAGKERDPPLARDDVAGAFRHHDAPLGGRRLDAEPDEG